MMKRGGRGNAAFAQTWRMEKEWTGGRKGESSAA
jgi:hypothetical protein